MWNEKGSLGGCPGSVYVWGGGVGVGAEVPRATTADMQSWPCTWPGVALGYANLLKLLSS